MKLFLKIFLLFIAVTVIFTLIGGYLAFINVRTLLEQEVSNRQTLLGQQVMDEIDIFLYERMQDIRTIGQAPPLIQALASDDKQVLDRAERKLKEFFNTTGPWDNLFVFDTKGTALLFSYESQDLLQRPGVSKAFQAAMKGNLYFSDAVLSVATNRPTVFFAVPMKNIDVLGSPIIGVVVGELAWPAVIEYLDKIPLPTILHLYNGQGLLVGSNQAEHKKEIFKLKSSSTIDDSVLAEKEAGSVPGTQSHEGVEVLQAYAKEQGHLSYVGNRWLLMIETPIDVAFGAAGAAAFKSTMQLVLMFVLFSVVILWLISRYGINPIVEMARLLGQHKADDFSVRLPVKTRDEIGALANKFNELAAANQKAYEKVEEKVAERTAELEQINKALVGRELKMIELKAEIQRIKKQPN